jgi:hypothetical protein
MISQAHRAYIYRVATAAVPLTVFYGLLADNAAALWLGLVGALLATGTNALAASNTSTKPQITYEILDGPPMVPVQDIKRLNVKPGETLLATVPHDLDLIDTENVRAQLQSLLPQGVKVAVVSRDLDLRVVSPEDEH